MTDPAEPLARRLESALLPRLGPVVVEELRPLSGGASRETWAFTAVTGDGAAHRLVLRRDPPGRPGEAGAMGREAAAIGAAARAGLAVPDVVVATDDDTLWGSAGLVMRHVDGETVARRILRDAGFGVARDVLVDQCAGFLAGLHGVDRSAVPGLEAVDPLDDLRAKLDEFAALDDGFGSPTFQLALRWLEANRPGARLPVIVHGDFRLGNLIVGPDGLRAVIDWELVHEGDPAADLGWFCVKAWRFGAAPPVAGLGTREQLLDAYRAAGGAPVTLDELHWWEVLNTLRWGVACLIQTWAHLSGAVSSVELAAVGRRVCEQEWDLLLLLEPAATAAATAAIGAGVGATVADPPTGHGRPTARELIAAVQAFLQGEVMDATTGPVAYHARVAANVLAIVGRELARGPVAAPGDPADPVALAVAVAAKLAVANPGYVDPARDER